MSRRLTAIIHREKDGFVAVCPELDNARQGDIIDAARDNLCEAIEKFFECASPLEVLPRPGGKNSRLPKKPWPPALLNELRFKATTFGNELP
jgi:predicted RNase H-like HicB family nuclease